MPKPTQVEDVQLMTYRCLMVLAKFSIFITVHHFCISRNFQCRNSNLPREVLSEEILKLNFFYWDHNLMHFKDARMLDVANESKDSVQETFVDKKDLAAISMIHG